MSEPLTLAEAVPLGTAHLQRLLADAGVRSLVIKGPAFVELGVRRPKQSNDIDLLIHPADRHGARTALETAGWKSISHWFPPELDDLIYSITYSHPLFPVSVDVHHYYSGVFGRAKAFEEMWAERTHVPLAHCDVETLCANHALVLESLNKFKAARPALWPSVAQSVVEGAKSFDSGEIARAAELLGARHSAGELILALGGPATGDPPSSEYERWSKQGGRFRSRMYFWRIVLRTPHAIPRVLWQQVTLPELAARQWADAHRVAYKGRVQILFLRLYVLVRGRR